MESEDPTQPLLTQLQAQVRGCRRCREAGLAVPGQPICAGPARAGLMIVGQAPSSSDELARRLWSGPAGRQLMAWLEWAGLPEASLRARHYLTAVTKCYPGPTPAGHGDRMPSRLELGLCRQYLNAELALVEPGLIVPVGRLAIDFFGGRHLRLEDTIGRAYSVDGVWIVPLPHPSGASLWLNEPENRVRLARALAILRELGRSLRLWEPPAPGPPKGATL